MNLHVLIKTNKTDKLVFYMCQDDEGFLFIS